MKLRSVSVAVLFAMVLLTMSAFPLPAAAVKGPRADDLIIYYYADVESAYAALKAGQIDAVGYEITADLYIDAAGDSNIVVGPVGDMGYYQIDMQHNWTIADDPTCDRSPMTYPAFRRALAFLLDKDWVIEEACGGFAERIDQMIPAPNFGWANASLWKPNYPYEYDPTTAAATLDAAGFVEGSTPNSYYDASFPGSAEYIRVYPTGHPQAGNDITPVKYCVRTDDIRRLETGRLHYANMRKHGIPVNVVEGPSAALYDQVMGDFNYHLYTGGWSAGRFPALGLYQLYHQVSWYPYGSNYYGGENDTGAYNWPELDAKIELARFPDTYDEAVVAVKNVVGYMTEVCFNIPLFSAKSYWAWSTDLLGVVNMNGYGPENGLTFLNAYKADDSAIRYGPKTAPVAMNIIHSQWYYDYQNLDRMNLYGGVDVQPYDLSADQTGFVTTSPVSARVGFWDDGGANKSKMTYTYRTDGYFVEPVTGNQLENVNASHMYASIWYDYQTGDGWFFSDVAELHHLNITGPNVIEVYFDSRSYWNAYYAQPPFKSFHLLQQGTLSTSHSEDFVAATADAYLGLSHEVYWVLDIYDDGGSLTRGSDWEIYIGGPGGYADIYIHAGVTITGTVHVDYLAVGDATGFTPGNLAWETAFEGAGAWYATAFTPGVGGSLTLKKSPFYYVETPLLAEIDWVKKPNGAYKIDIFDVVKAASAYGSQGTGVPSSNWFAGADLAPEGGKIDIFDIVTITGKYGQEFDLPP
jgi:hypothetical protein